MTRPLDRRYDALVADPIATVDALLRALELPPASAAHRAAMEEYLRANAEERAAMRRSAYRGWQRSGRAQLPE